MSKHYFPTIGLEIHAELKTATKMFCNSKNDVGETRPNVNICPVCLGHPGTLPTVNKEAVRHILRMGLAVRGDMSDYTEFDRKNYFYPDIPKGYQISQYQYPLIRGGTLSGIALTRIHLEEDTAKSFHLKEGEHEYSLIDFNRAGVPLMELVTEPVITSSEEAVRFAKELQLLLRALSVSDAHMEKGEMRVEANVSVSGEKGKLGKKVEVKNLNSFRALQCAIEYECRRQVDLLEEGKEVVQETRGWDEDREETFSQRAKEESHDYRYFPDPDIPRISLATIKEFSPEFLDASLPELPSEWRQRLVSSYGIKKQDADLYVSEPTLGVFFERVSALLPEKKAVVLASNYIVSDLVGLEKAAPRGEDGFDLRIKAEDFAALIRMVSSNEISSRGAKDILRSMHQRGGSPREVAKELNLFQESDAESLRAIVSKVLSAHPTVVLDFKGGKESALHYLIGQCMKETQGSANPSVLREILKEALK